MGRPPVAARVARVPFGALPDGAGVDAFILTNARGLEARVITYGAILASLRVPDRWGALDDIVLGFDSAAAYARERRYYLGAIVGRCANRIARGRFELDGRTWQLSVNSGGHHLHGGVRGFDSVLWHPQPAAGDRAGRVRFTHVSPAGDEGYPGALTAHMTYTLTDDDELIFDYEAAADSPTIVNLTQHSYFNLAGGTSADVLDHELQIDADRYTPVDEGLIPTGQLAPVEGTPFDFRTPTPIGARIDRDDPQLRRGDGYDHNFALARGGGGLQHAARVLERSSGRTLDVWTAEPGLQLYTGNVFDGATGGKGRVHGRRCGFSLETQHFPDAPNQPHFPSTVLRPGAAYRSRTVLRFATEDP